MRFSAKVVKVQLPLGQRMIILLEQYVVLCDSIDLLVLKIRLHFGQGTPKITRELRQLKSIQEYIVYINKFSILHQKAIYIAYFIK